MQVEAVWGVRVVVGGALLVDGRRLSPWDPKFINLSYLREG